MGIRIINQDTSITVIQPFTKKELRERSVLCWCNVQTHLHNILYGFRTKNKPVLNPGFIIELSIASFRVIAKTGNHTFQEFAKKLNGDRQVLFSPSALPLDAAMHQCIYSITHYAEDETLKPMYLYARVVDLLRLQQQSYMRTLIPQTNYVKTEYDKERIVFARDYLITHLDAPPSLTKLAAIAGINEFKLKRGFKEVFNHTVFGYLADLRLEMARTALREKQKTVTQIAFELGYASLQHFSAAFKKKFGVPPVKFS